MSIKINIEIKKNLAKNWFILLRDIICYEIEELEKEFGIKKNKKPKRLESQIWKKSNNKDEGGGEFRNQKKIGKTLVYNLTRHNLF